MNKNNDNIQSIICNYLCEFGRLSKEDLKILLNSIYRMGISDSKLEYYINELKRVNAIKQDPDNGLYAMPNTNTQDFDSIYLPDYIINKCLLTVQDIAVNLNYIDMLMYLHKPVTVAFRGITKTNNELYFELIYVQKDKGYMMTSLVDAKDYFVKSGFSSDSNSDSYEKLMSTVRRYVIVESVDDMDTIGIHNIYAYVIMKNNTPFFKIIGGKSNE